MERHPTAPHMASPIYCERLMKTLGPKHPLEIKTLRFNFSGEIAGAVTLVSAAPTTATAVDGTDATPGNTVLGLPVIVGQEVLQRITGGVDLTSYLFESAVTDSAGNVHVAQALVAVSRKLY